MPIDTQVDRNGLEILQPDECLRLLASAKVGRVGMTTDAMPVVLPVTFALVGHRVVFASTPGTKLYLAMDQALVAFEADDVAPDLSAGWSVCLTGRARIVGDDERLAQEGTLALQPWSDAADRALIAIDGQVITGRRIHLANRDLSEPARG